MTPHSWGFLFGGMMGRFGDYQGVGYEKIITNCITIITDCGL